MSRTFVYPGCQMTIRSFLFSLLDFLVGGSIGYIATYFAIRRLYGSIRVD